MLIYATILVMLCYLLYQDLKHRAIYWICFPVLLLLLVLAASRDTDIISVVEKSFYNVCFVASQLLLLTVYFSIKHRRIINITSSLIGLGDVLMLFTLAFYFSPLNYLLFYVASLFVVLLLVLGYGGIFKERVAKVPLAGFQAFICGLFLLADWTSRDIDLLNDAWLMFHLRF